MYMYSKYFQFVHYADATTVIQNTKYCINNGLDHLYIWLQSDRLTLNVSKGYFMIDGNVQNLNKL